MAKTGMDLGLRGGSEGVALLEGVVETTIDGTDEAVSSTTLGRGTSRVTWGRETSLRVLGGRPVLDPSLSSL